MEQQAPAFAADSEAALQRVTESGALDELRRQALKALRDKPELRKKAEDLVRRSRALQYHRSQGGRANKQLFGEVKKELEAQMTEETIRAMWEVLTDERYGITQQIERTVHQALCGAVSEKEKGEGGGGSGSTAPQAAGGQPAAPRNLGAQAGGAR